MKAFVVVALALCFSFASAGLPTRTPTSTPTPTPTPTPTTPAYGSEYGGSGYKDGTWDTGYGQCGIIAKVGEYVSGISPEFFGNPVSQTCGVCLKVTGGAGSVVVKVVDRCGGCPKGTLNLSPSAYAAVTGPASLGNKPITWEPVACASSQGALFFQLKTSNKDYLSLQVQGYKTFLTDVSVLKGGVYVPLKLADYNYWIGYGIGAGPFTVRLTQQDGTITVVSGIPLINGQPIKYEDGKLTIVWTPTPAPTRTPTKFLITPTPKALIPGKTYSGKGARGGQFLPGNGCGNYLVTPSSLVAGISVDLFANSAICGTCLSVKGPAGTRTVRIVDSVSLPSGTVALNPTSYAAIAGTAPGPVDITYSIIKCTSNSSALGFKFNNGANQYYLSILPVGSMGNIKALDVWVGGQYVSLALQTYAEWVGSANFGAGPYTIRVTYANAAYPVLTFSGVALAPGKLSYGTLVTS